MYLLLFSFYRPCWLNTRVINQRIPKVRVFVWSGTITWKSQSFQGHPSLPEGQRGQTIRSKWHSRRQRKVKLILNQVQIPMPALWFSAKQIFLKELQRGLLDVKTLTNSRSSHLLLYSFLPRCYCEKLAVKFNWFRIFRIHMAANPGAEAAIAPHCCSQAFASPLVPRWWE